MVMEMIQRRWYERLLQGTGQTRIGAWMYAPILHRVDIPLLRVSRNRSSLTSILTGLPVVTLTSIGVKSGKPRSLPLVGMEDGESVVLIASNFGRGRHPAWYHNLRANPEARLAWNGRSGVYLASEAEGEERVRLWQRANELYAGYEVYQRRAGRRRIPVMVMAPKTELAFPAASLLGVQFE